MGQNVVNRSKIQNWLLLGIVLVTLFVSVVKWFWPKPTYSDIARNLVQGLISGNASAVEDLIPRRELDAYKWGAKDVRRFVEQFVGPRLRGLREKTVIEKSNVNRGFAGIYTVTVTDGIHEFDIGQMVKATPEGPKSSLRNIITMIWIVRAQRAGDAQQRRTTYASLLQTLRSDRHELELLGVTGLFSDGDTPVLRTWPEIEAGFQREIGMTTSSQN